MNDKRRSVNNTGNISKEAADRLMLVLIVIVLLVFGLIMLYSASSYNSQIKFELPHGI